MRGSTGAKSTGLASFLPTSFLKQLFVQSKADSRSLLEVSRVLHLAQDNIKCSRSPNFHNI